MKTDGQEYSSMAGLLYSQFNIRGVCCMSIIIRGHGCDDIIITPEYIYAE